MQKSRTSKLLSRFAWLVLLFYLVLLSPPIAYAKNEEVSASHLFDGRLVYDGADSNIYYLDGETGIIEPVTSDAAVGAGYFGPTFSPTGQHIAFCQSDEALNSAMVHVAAVEDLIPKMLVRTFNCEYDWSPDGRSIVFGRPSTYNLESGNWDNASGIWSIDIATETENELIPRPRQYPLTDPQWSPDGNWMLYEEVTYIEGRGTNHVWNRTTGISTSPPIVGSSEWSPDSQYLVSDEVKYVGRENMGIYLTSPTSIYPYQRQRVYLHRSYYTIAPRFSPDGTRIAFFRGIPFEPDDQMLIVNRNGSLVKQIDTPIYWLQDWLPDGERLLITHPKSDYRALSFYYLNDSSLTTIVQPVGFGADWMPSPPKYRIIGNVTDPAGKGIEGVRITDNMGHSTTTRQFGAYELTGIPPGNYTLTAHKDGYTFGPKSLDVSLPYVP